jgi:TonB family protein
MTKIALPLSFLILGSLLVAQGAPDVVGGATQDKVYHVGGNVKAPRAISSLRPNQGDSSENVRGKGKKTVDAGSSILSIIVDKDGSVRNVKVVRGLKPDLDAKAVETVKQWKFDPATKKGTPVAVELHVQVDFHLYK